MNDELRIRILRAWGRLSRHVQERLRPASRWMPGGAFCDCGQVEFPILTPARVRTHGDLITVHTPSDCHVESEEELRNLDSKERKRDGKD